MKLKVLLVFFLTSFYLSSQQTVTTSGGDIESNQVSLSYTIGQLKVNTIEKVESSIIKLDFVQGVQYAIDVFDCRDYNNIKISVFPNPTSSIVNISMGNIEDKLSLIVYDVAGRKIYDHSFSEKDFFIDFSSYSEGIYILSFYNFCGLFRSFKLAVNKQ
tara:strand:+ start:737 stop:1213 length:477 start_codon:yes stop_codon:yes gene_type:complete